ncbi:AAA family ATPase, partial [Staphylococcus aureus]|nr:AAA family ATPase [Staphylococcus aureus]
PSVDADEAFRGHYQCSSVRFARRVPGFKFLPAQRKPVLGQLHHLARYSQLLLLVTGPLGSGKTLLRQALVASTNKDAVLSVVISARTAADETSLLRQVAQGLSINQASLEAILTNVAQPAITGQDVYLMVDDAEQPQDSALEVLVLLASGHNEGRLQAFLLGQPSLLPLALIHIRRLRTHPTIRSRG